MFEKILYLAIVGTALFTLTGIGILLYCFLPFWLFVFIMVIAVLGTLISLASVIASGRCTRFEENSLQS